MIPGLNLGKKYTPRTFNYTPKYASKEMIEEGLSDSEKRKIRRSSFKAKMSDKWGTDDTSDKAEYRGKLIRLVVILAIVVMAIFAM